ncbi:MAG: replicative DNA helicase [Puniceicoccales bacterium]|jgi:replicative DNA helicase|nr:replicative DNA helicase [Puniceicoccales bacterium]
MAGPGKFSPKLGAQPHGIDIEQALLSCCILEGGQESMPLCIQRRVSADSFYLPWHRLLFQEMLALYHLGKPLDEVMLKDALAAKGLLDKVGGAPYLAQLCSRIDTHAHLEYIIGRIRDYELIRRVVATASGLAAEAPSRLDDVPSFLGQAEEKIFAISQDILQETAVSIDVPLQRAVQNVQFLLQHRGDLLGVGSGFVDLDRLTSGFQRGEMVVIAARPSMGKTSLALNIAEHNIAPPPGKKPVPTLFFSLEMGAEQLAMRMICSRAGMGTLKMRNSFVSRESQADLLRCAETLRGAPLWIDESSNLHILELRARARRVHGKQRLGLIIVDYLQLIAGMDSRVGREQQIAEISRGIKAMAKELQVPVLVLSQLNRDSERENRRPRLSDLRESGAIEQDADVVLLLAKVRDRDDEPAEEGQIALRELILAKQRNGPTGVITLAFDRELTKFQNYGERGDGTAG